MDINDIIDLLNSQPNLALSLGMTFRYDPQRNECTATMPVGGKNCQPFGLLSGGATLAMAETLAGLSSGLLCPGAMCMGVNVSGNHLKAVSLGDCVTAHATLLSRGKTIHTWQVNVTNTAGETTAIVTVTNYIKGNSL